MIEELRALSIEELLSIKVTGEVVRSLGFDQTIQTDELVQTTIFKSPTSVDIINSKTIEARGLKNVIEATENVTGVTSGVSPSEPYGFSMRGFSRDHVKILYDGINLGIASLNTRPIGTSNLEEIEIIKGPASLTRGACGAGGTINFISKQPSLMENHVRSMYLMYGKFNTTLVNAEMKGPISETLAYRADASRNASSGWANNSQSQVINANASVLFQPNEKVKNYFTINFAHDNLPAYWGLPLLPKDIAEKPLDAVKTNDGTTIDGALRTTNYNVQDNLIGSNSIRLMYDLKLKFSDAVSSNTKLYYFKAKREWENAENYLFDSASQSIVRDRFSVYHDREIYGFISSVLLKNEILGMKSELGFNVEYTQNDFDRSVGFLNGIQDTVSLRNPNPGNFGSVDSRKDIYNEGNLALVAHNKLHVNSKLTIELTGRLENLIVERERYNFDGSPRANQSIDDSYIQGSYRIGISYLVVDELILYGNNSFQHGPFSGDIGTTAVSQESTFRPSDITQTEFGLKSSLFDNKLELALAVYQINRSIAIEQVNHTSTENKQFAQGIEFTTKTSFFDRYKIGGGIAYNHSHFENYYDANFDMDVSGNTPDNAPAIVGDLWMSYNQLVKLPIEVGIGYKFVSDRQANTSNTVILTSYQLINTFLAYNLNDNFRFTFYVRNLTNKDYVPWGDIFYPTQFILGTPRTYELSFSAKF